MKIKEIRFEKQYKIGLPNYSNITAGYGMTVEVGEGEKIDNDACWDMVNQQLGIQSSNIEPSWIQTGEFQNFFKTTIRVPKKDEKAETKT